MQNLFHKGLCEITFNTQITVPFKNSLKINLNTGFFKKQLYTGKPILLKLRFQDMLLLGVTNTNKVINR